MGERSGHRRRKRRIGSVPADQTGYSAHIPEVTFTMAALIALTSKSG
jgi:hypothetical protein